MIDNDNTTQDIEREYPRSVLPPNTKEFVDDLCADPEKARQFLIRVGILEKGEINV